MDPLIDSTPKKSSALAKCEKHGLHYDPAKMNGCVICRREAGGGARPAAAAAAAENGSLGAALAVAALLILIASGGLYFVHGLLIESFRGMASGDALGEDGFATPGFAPALEEAPFGEPDFEPLPEHLEDLEIP